VNPKLAREADRHEKEFREIFCEPLIMPAKIKHIAIVSDQYALEGRFYEAVFGMRSAADSGRSGR